MTHVPYRTHPTLWHTEPHATAACPQTATVRPCGCDLDVLVFGHIICRTVNHGLFAKHITCACTTCDCACHKRK